eukprot:763940-Hanusia_phi.AAC.14
MGGPERLSRVAMGELVSRSCTLLAHNDMTTSAASAVFPPAGSSRSNARTYSWASRAPWTSR